MDKKISITSAEWRASCASVIEYGLKKEKGVNSASVNFGFRKSLLILTKSKTTEKEISKYKKDWDTALLRAKWATIPKG